MTLQWLQYNLRSYLAIELVKDVSIVVYICLYIQSQYSVHTKASIIPFVEDRFGCFALIVLSFLQ